MSATHYGPQLDMWQSQISVNCKIDSDHIPHVRCNTVLTIDNCANELHRFINEVDRFILFCLLRRRHNKNMIVKSCCARANTHTHARTHMRCAHRVCDMNGMLIVLIAHSHTQFHAIPRLIILMIIQIK